MAKGVKDVEGVRPVVGDQLYVTVGCAKDIVQSSRVPVSPPASSPTYNVHDPFTDAPANKPNDCSGAYVFEKGAAAVITERTDVVEKHVFV